MKNSKCQSLSALVSKRNQHKFNNYFIFKHIKFVVNYNISDVKIIRDKKKCYSTSLWISKHNTKTLKLILFFLKSKKFNKSLHSLLIFNVYFRLLKICEQVCTQNVSNYFEISEKVRRRKNLFSKTKLDSCCFCSHQFISESFSFSLRLETHLSKRT